MTIRLMSAGAAASLSLVLSLGLADRVLADPQRPPAEISAPQSSFPEWDVHAQATFVDQFHPAFRAPYEGPNSLNRGARGNETFDATLYLGVRPWAGAELWVDPELDQGFGLSNTLGVAGFPSGEAYKIGKPHLYYRTQRIFLRQTVNLGGETHEVDADLNVMAGKQADNRLVFTVGKFSVGDVFDASSVAHDPRNDFLNWAVIDAGTLDYAADAWGYTPGAAVEWYAKPWVARVALMDLSNVPNSSRWDTHFDQLQLIAEVERDWTVKDLAGDARVTAYASHGRMGRYSDALALGAATSAAPSTGLVRKYHTRPGVSLLVDQQLSPEVTAFARAGWADAHYEPYEFADIDTTVSGGLSAKGKAWGRADDTLGVAAVINHIGGAHRRYLGAGGLGILIGDGKLPHYGDERIMEAYYKVPVAKGWAASLDFQVIDNPAYNRDRGPVAAFGLRLHWQK